MAWSGNLEKGKKRPIDSHHRPQKRFLLPLTGLFTLAQTFGYLDYLADLHDRLLSRFMRWLFYYNLNDLGGMSRGKMVFISKQFSY